MEPLGNTLREVMGKLKAQRKLAPRHDPERLLKKILSRQELRHAKMNYLKKGVLNIKVDSSSWLYHLSLQKEELLRKLRSHTQTIQDIRFHLGEMK